MYDKFLLLMDLPICDSKQLHRNVTRQLETWSKTFQDLPSLSDASEPQYVPIRIVQGKYIFGELHLFYDELEWDLSSAKIEAEVYAMRMANDFGLGPEMAAAIATEFKKQVEKASKAVSSGDLLPSRSPAKGYNESRRRNACPIVLRGDEAKQLITEKRKRKAGNASSVEQKGANNSTESSIGLADDRKLPSEGS